jgi:hypothetical protein
MVISLEFYKRVQEHTVLGLLVSTMQLMPLALYQSRTKCTKLAPISFGKCSRTALDLLILARNGFINVVAVRVDFPSSRLVALV